MLDVNKIYCGDFSDFMGELPPTVSAVITDPPYNIGYKYSSYPDQLSADEYINMLSSFGGIPSAIISYPEETMKYVAPALGTPDEVLIWCYNSNIRKQSRLISIYGLPIYFERVLQPYKNPRDKRIKALIDGGSEGTPIYDWFSDIQLEKNVCKDKKEYPHPCPVPVKLMERIILLTTEVGDVILDPFMGSGTMAIACIRTFRQYIGIEISPEYCATAERRIKDELS